MAHDFMNEPDDEIQERRRAVTISMRELEDHIDARIKQRLDNYAREEAQRFDAKFDELKALLRSAFPGGDPEEHRRYHDEAIEFMRERRELWKSIRERSITGLVWAALIALGSAVWHYLQLKLGVK